MLTLQFDLGGSVSVPASPGVLPSLTGTPQGQASIVLSGVNSLGMITAPMASGRLTSLLALVLLNGTATGPGGSAMFSGLAQIQQIGTAAGAFDGMQLVFQPGQVTQAISVVLDCQGALCASFSAGGATNFITANTAPLALGLSGLDMAGGAQLQASIRALFFPFTGREVSRRFVGMGGGGDGGEVPEPLHMGLLLSGLGLLALTRLALVRARLLS